MTQTRHTVVAIGASAGGLNALTVVLSGLPAGLPAAVVVVQHLDPRYPSIMADILDRRTPLHVVQAEEGMALKLSTVYMAPPDHHMLVEKNRIHLTTTELVHFVRPSADLLLESVAAAYGPVCVGVVLTGSGKDGALGIRAIKVKGGLTIAQDPVSAESRSMPAAAIATGAVDKVLPLEDIADAIIQATALEERNA